MVRNLCVLARCPGSEYLTIKLLASIAVNSRQRICPRLICVTVGRFSSTGLVGLRPQFLAGCWPEGALSSCHTGLTIGWFNTLWFAPSEQAGNRAGENKTEGTVFRNLMSQVTSGHICCILFLSGDQQVAICFFH